MAKGVYRTENGDVAVDYGTTGRIDMNREQYEDRGYEPPFDQLPLKSEYEANEAAAKGE